MNTAPAMPVPPAPARPRRRALAPLEPVSPRAQWLLGLGFFVLFFAVWGVATLGGFVSPTFLADPVTMAARGLAAVHRVRLHPRHRHDGVARARRLRAGRASSPCRWASPMGAYKPIEAFFEPFVSFARYLPASAFIPLLILWAGIGETQKLLVIFIGSFFQIVLMVAVTVGSTRRDLVEAAYTLGATTAGIVTPGAAARRRARDRRDPAAGARLGLDLRDRRRADRLVLGHRPHDHRQPGAAQHRPDHLRHHRHRR